MSHRSTTLMVTVVAALVLAGGAAAFDCVRVSASSQGVNQSAKSGRWLPFDLSSAAAAQATLAHIGVETTIAQAHCFHDAYAGSGQPTAFSLGIGVAGPNGVLAHANTRGAMGDGKGVDHLEQSGILSALLAAGAACGIL